MELICWSQAFVGLYLNPHPQLAVLIYCHITWLEVLGKTVKQTKEERNMIRMQMHLQIEGWI